MNYITQPLNPALVKHDFSSGVDLLDNYLHRQAAQDVKRRLAACFVWADSQHLVKAYYTLSSASIDRNLLPEAFQRKLPPSYHHLPVTLLGRLAVDVSIQGKGYGKLLLLDALKRSFEASHGVGSLAVIVDPIDARAVDFYRKYGFIDLPDSGKMFLPMKTIATLFQA